VKTIKLLLVSLGISLTMAACTPAEVQTWFMIQSEGEVELTNEEARAVSDWIISENAKKARLTPTVPRVLVAIGSCESGNGRYGAFSYSAKNPSSTASGRYQFLNSTWRYVSRSYASTWQAHGWESLRQEALAVGSMRAARPEVQDAAGIVLLEREGTRPWNASRGCWRRWA
jgi:hypothetical protein